MLVLQKIIAIAFVFLVNDSPSISLVDATGCVGLDEVCSICVCSNNNTDVDCSSMEMTSAPIVLPWNLLNLTLFNNSINGINNRAFNNCGYLQHLDLSYNFISHLPRDLFKDLGTSLTYLNLQSNRLNLENNTNIFTALSPSLKELYIHRNNKISHQVLDGLYLLEKLHVDGNIVGGFGISFSSLTSLESFRVHPPLKLLTNVTFKHLKKCKNLKELSLERVGIEEIDRNVFRPLESLRSLNLGSNYNLNLENVSHSFESLPDSMEELVLNGLIGNYRPTLWLTEAIYKNLRKMKLKKLKLNQNGLLYIDNSFMFALRNLEHLDISFNRITTVFGMTAFVFVMTNLTELIADNQLKKFDFSNKTPKNRERSAEAVSNREDALQAPTKTQHRYMKTNCIVNGFKPCKFPTSNIALSIDSWCIPSPRSLQVIEASGVVNEVMDDMPTVIFLGDMRATKIYFGNNGIKFLRQPIILDRPRGTEASTIDFSYNLLICFAPNIFEMSIKKGFVIGRLILEGNDLSDQLTADKEGETFALYTNLTELNVANNKLKMLGQNVFSGLISLEILNISKNSLQIIAFNIFHMKKLRILDLSYNLFVVFDANLRSSLSSISSEKGYWWLTLDIRGNPFQCSCDSLGFMNWLSENSTKIDNLFEVTCVYLNSLISIKEVKSITKKFMFTCNYIPLVIVGVMVGLVMLCTLIGVVAHKYRWDIRYFLIKQSQQRKQYELLFDPVHNYLYDAFISYDTKDRRWIIEELIPNLEAPNSRLGIAASPSSQFFKQSPDAKSKLLQTTSDCRSGYGTISSTTVEEDSRPEDCCLEDGESSRNSTYMKLCVHDRDFEPANEIETNILEAIQRSRMVILVVTKNFVKSKWCRLELEMSKMESLDRGMNIILTVFLEPIQETLESLKWLMKRYTYLEWFKYDNVRKRKLFWAQVRRALGGERNEKVICDCGREFFN